MYKRLLTMLLKSKETDVCFHFLRDKALTIWGCVQKKKLNKCQIFYNNFTKEFVKFPFDTKRLSVMKQVF